MASMSEAVVKVRTELDNIFVVRPGDKLIVARADRISQPDGERLKARIGELLPGVDVVIISECSGLAVYREHEDGVIARALRDIWNRIEESDEAISPAWLRRVIVESGAWRGHEDD